MKCVNSMTIEKIKVEDEVKAEVNAKKQGRG
jgi:hypothetical protein